MREKKFHHGNLRAELVDLAALRIEEVGYEDLSLRELAGTLGVSAGAPYRHFANKDALLQTVAEGALEQLNQAYREALNADCSPEERFRLACRSYLELARVRPQVFRMMFMSEAYLRAQAESGPIASYALFVDLAAAAFSENDRSAAELIALAAWSTIHGFAIIRLDSRTPPVAQTDEAVEAVLDRACAAGRR